MKTLIQYRKTERFLMLYALYRRSNGMSMQSFNMRDLAAQEGIGLRAFRAAFDFLCQERLIAMQSYSEGFGEGYYANLTEAGIAAVEKVFQDELSATDFFPAYREMMM